MKSKKPSRRGRAGASALVVAPTLRVNAWGRFFAAFRLQALVVGAFSALLYANTLNHEYALDDGLVILVNNYTKKGLKGIPKLLSTDSYEGSLGKKQTDLLPGGRYRPLSLVTFAVEYEFFGENPRISHAVNVLLYALSCVSLLWLLHRHLWPARKDAAFFTALIFAAHPVHTEAVANIKGRDEILSFLFVVWTFVFAYKYWRKPGAGTMAALLACFFLALLSKENALILPVLLPATMFVFPPRKYDGKVGEEVKALARFSLWLWAGAAAYFAVRFSATGVKLGGGDDDVLNNPYVYATTAEKYGTIVYVLARYVVLAFWPHPLSYDYSWQQITYRGPDSPEVWISLIVLAACAAFVVVFLPKRNYWAWCAAFFFLSLALVSNIPINIGAFMGDRLLYQATWGVAALWAGIVLLTDKTGAVMSEKTWPFARALPYWALFVVALAYGAKTFSRNPDWKNNQTLFLTDVRHAPNSAKTNKGAAEALISLGRDDEAKGDTAAAHQKFRRALEYQARAIALHPRYNDAWLDRGTAYFLLERYDSAEVAWRKAGEINPNHSTFKANWKILAAPHYNAAIAFSKQQRYDTAAVLFQKAVRYDSTNAVFWYVLANTLAKAGRLTEGVEAFKQAARYDPDNVEYLYNLGGAAYTDGQYELARSAWERTLKLKPDHPQARAGLNALNARKPK
ncbi:MAG: tetratricopeptide repeat protein [Bacteroidia bacterium]|nr:tetratricopeptide repeat protein [Bacteroidia bacterium]MDW8332639.1 tetratricopeptide repeat protein [Bacteroidia bacterium]